MDEKLASLLHTAHGAQAALIFDLDDYLPTGIGNIFPPMAHKVAIYHDIFFVSVVLYHIGIFIHLFSFCCACRLYYLDRAQCLR